MIMQKICLKQRTVLNVVSGKIKCALISISGKTDVRQTQDNSEAVLNFVFVIDLTYLYQNQPSITIFIHKLHETPLKLL